MIHTESVLRKLAADTDVWAMIQLAGRQQHIYLPSSYAAESPMQLAPPHLTDTSDRSLARTWERLTGRPSEALKYYYVTPYLTCVKCNGLVFVDIAKMVGAGTEELGRCPGCGSSVDYRLGAWDLLDEIGQSKEDVERMLRERRRAARLLVRAYRTYLRRELSRARGLAILVRGMVRDRCASIIAGLQRGRLGRRKAKTIRSLRVIRAAHPVSLARALRGDGDVWGTRKVPEWYKPMRRKVFWYKSKQQLTLLHHDYVELASRLGFLPPRSEVEANIAEIARRIELREARLVAAVQSRWRALTVRKLIVVFQLEKIYIREVRAAAAFRILKQVRTWMAKRAQVATRRLKLSQAAVDRTYKTAQARRLEDERQSVFASALRAAYVKERRDERTARYCGLVRPSAAGGNKMKAFSESAYGSTDVVDAANRLAACLAGRAQADEAEAAADRARGAELKARCARDPAFAVYHRAELKKRATKLMLALTDPSSRDLQPKKTRAVDLLRRYNRRACPVVRTRRCSSPQRPRRLPQLHRRAGPSAVA